MKNKQLFATQKQKADELFDAGKIEESFVIFQKLHHQQPSNVAVLLGMAQCLVVLGKPDDALDILDAILTEIPDLDIAILFKAQYLGEADRVQDAIQFLEGKIKSGFNDPEGYAVLGELYQKDDKPILAITEFQNALGFSSLLDRIAVSCNQANCYAEIGNYKKAIKIYDELLKINPDNLVVLTNKALLLKEINDLSECLKILLRVTSLDPEFLDAWIILADLYVALGADDKSKECVDKIKELIAKQNK